MKVADADTINLEMTSDLTDILQLKPELFNFN